MGDDRNAGGAGSPVPSPAGRRAAPLGESFRCAVRMLCGTGALSLAGLVVMTVIRGLVPGVQVFAVSTLVSSVADADGSLHPRGTMSLALLAAAILTAYVLDNLMKYVGDRLTLRLSYDTDMQVTSKLCALEVQDFESADTYDTIQRVDSTTGEHIFGLFDTARSAVQSVIAIFGVAAVVASWNGWIALILLVAPVPAAVATFRLQARAYDIEYARAPQSRLASYFRALLTSDAVRKEIRIFRLARMFQESYAGLRKRFLDQDGALIRYNLTQAGTLGLVSAMANVAVIVFASIVAAGGSRVGELAGFISATTQMNGLVLAAFLGVTGIYQHLLYVSNWVALIRMKPSPIREGTLAPTDGAGGDAGTSDAVAVEFRHVSFTYPGTDNEVLHDVSFTVPAGTTAALVGLNGSGKTTACKLLLRFYEPTGGRILIDGIDIREYDRDYLYARFSALFQDFARFERSLGDNVAFGMGEGFSGGGRTAVVLGSLEAVGLGYLPDELPDGLDTVLGRRFEGGRQLSIGQWQRVAMARALCKRPGLLVLDEPTASVDAVSEKAMFDALAGLDRGMTVLLVAHRFTTIGHAENIVVLDRGSVVGTGDHATLLENCKFYADMFHAQECYGQ